MTITIPAAVAWGAAGVPLLLLVGVGLCIRAGRAVIQAELYDAEDPCPTPPFNS